MANVGYYVAQRSIPTYLVFQIGERTNKCVRAEVPTTVTMNV
jgi:hypothetical protein